MGYCEPVENSGVDEHNGVRLNKAQKALKHDCVYVVILNTIVGISLLYVKILVTSGRIARL